MKLPRLFRRHAWGLGCWHERKVPTLGMDGEPTTITIRRGMAFYECAICGAKRGPFTAEEIMGIGNPIGPLPFEDLPARGCHGNGKRLL